MKGHIFNLLEEFLIETAGAETFETIYQNVDFESEGVFVTTGNYPDADLVKLVHEAVRVLGITIEQAHVAFGKWMFPHLTKLVPTEVIDVGHPKNFLMQLNAIHEVELKKLWPDARPPLFNCEDTGQNTMTFVYDSPRQMFDLVEGVLAGVRDYYKVGMQWKKLVVEGQQGYPVARFDIQFDQVA